MMRAVLRERGAALFWWGVTFLVGVLVVGLVGLSWIFVPRTELSAFERKVHSADTLLLYEIAPGEKVRFPSRAGQQIFYVITHLLLSSHQRYDPEEDFDYSIVAAFSDKLGRPVAQHVFAERSRQSKASPMGHDWLLENAFVAPGKGQLTDDRVTMLGVGALLPEGGYVTLSSKDTIEPVLLRIYRIDERPDIDRLKRYKLLPEHRKDSMARYMGYESLEQLSLSDLLVLFQRKWERIEAQTTTGDSPRTRRIYYHGFRLARPALDDAVMHLEPGRRGAFNVEGPCSFKVVSAQLDSLPALWLGGVSTTGQALEQKAMIWEEGRSQLLTVPQGPWSLVLDNRSKKRVDVRVAFETAPTRSIGQARLSPDTTGKFAAYVIPERVEMVGAITAAGEDVRFSSLAFVPSQLLVLELRSLLDGPQDFEPRKFEVTYYDRLGKTLRTFENEAVAKASFFEGLAGPKNEPLWVSEAFDVLVAPPANARYVGVSAGRPMIVRGFVETGFESVEIDAYPIVEPPAVWRLRQVPRPGWARVEPANRGVLAAQDRISKVVGQTRIELLDEQDEGTTDWRSTPVRGAAQEEIMLGEVFPAETEAAVSDNRALRLSCAPGTKARVSLIPDPSAENLGILDVTYYVPSSLELGGLIGVEQEGRAVAKIVPVTRLDSVRVRKVRRQADLLWTHEFKGGDPRLFVRIAPGRGRPYAPPAGCRAYRSYTVTRLPPGGAVSLAVDADPLDPRAVNIVAYGTKADSLVALIDQGRLRRAAEPRVGRPTRATQEVALTWRPKAASSFLLMRPDEPLHTSLTAFVQLGADLSKGTHTLTLRNKGAREVWFRAFQAAKAPQKKSSVEVKRLQ